MGDSAVNLGAASPVEQDMRRRLGEFSKGNPLDALIAEQRLDRMLKMGDEVGVYMDPVVLGDQEAERNTARVLEKYDSSTGEEVPIFRPEDIYRKGIGSKPDFEGMSDFIENKKMFEDLNRNHGIFLPISDFSGMSMDEMMFGASDPAAAYRATRPSYDEFGQGYDYRDGQFQPAVDEEGYNLEIMNPSRSAAIQGREFEQEYGRADPYEGLAKPAKLRGFSEATELYLQDGGNPAVEEAGIMSALLDPRIDLPSSEEQGLVRESARTGSEGAAMYYPEGSPTFEQVLMDQYGYPDVDREIEYGTSTTAQMRAERPRHDMPTYQELEDARAHALQTALLAKDMGPETATKVGGLGEMFDRYMPILGTATDADVVMDKRNNAFGAQLLAKAGVDATPQQLTKMVDQAVFDQLDVVLGREPGERRFKSPDTGIDIFFPRDAQGFFDINRYD